MFEISSGVPVPPVRGRGGPRVFPFPDMKVGDSFTMPVEPATPDQLAKVAYRAYMAVGDWRKLHPEQKHSVRRLGDKVGVWRLPDRETLVPREENLGGL